MSIIRKSLAWFSLPFFAACSTGGDGDGLNSSGDGDGSTTRGAALSLFNPVAASPQVPFPFDAFFSGSTDGTLNIPNASSAPFVTQANLQDGFSTTASAFADFFGEIDFSTVLSCSGTTPTAPPGITIVRQTGPTSFVPLAPCADFTVQTSNAIDATNQPISAYRTRILIEPLKPLAPSSRYLVTLTNAIRSTDGIQAIQSDLFRVTKSSQCITTINPMAPCTTPQTDPALAGLSTGQLQTLEGLRSQIINPVVMGFAGAGIPAANQILSWPFTTQSTGKTLTRLNANATAQTIAAAFTGLNTQNLNAALGNTANVFLGIQSVPYYLNNSGGSTASTAPLGTFWASNATRDTADPVPTATGVTCTNLAAISASTTRCFPDPLLRSTETLPLLVTVPNSNRPGGCTAIGGAMGNTCAKPMTGWPVVIFQHGITRNRSDMLAIAPTLAAAGFVAVAIDLPLHGITDTTSPLYRNQAFTGSPASGLVVGNERTFDLDLANNTTSAAGPDGVIDSSGTHFINLASLITSRDNNRQGVADLITLTKSLVNLSVDGSAGGDIDTSKIYFVGQSLGSIVGTTFLGVNSDVKSAVLSVPGSGIAKLLDASKSFGPRIAAGLAGNNIIEGTDTYETFLRFAQTLVDSGDPANFAGAANTNHGILLHQVMGDLVVPNSAPANDGSGVFDRVTLTGFLSGTDPLNRIAGLTDDVAVLTPPYAAGSNCAGDRVLRFGPPAHHGSLLSPSATGGTPTAAEVQVTTEMQRQMATFLATHAAVGANVVSVPGGCPGSGS